MVVLGIWNCLSKRNDRRCRVDFQHSPVNWPKAIQYLVGLQFLGELYPIRRDAIRESVRQYLKEVDSPKTILKALDQILDALRGEPPLISNSHMTETTGFSDWATAARRLLFGRKWEEEVSTKLDKSWRVFKM